MPKMVNIRALLGLTEPSFGPYHAFFGSYWALLGLFLGLKEPYLGLAMPHLQSRTRPHWSLLGQTNTGSFAILGNYEVI